MDVYYDAAGAWHGDSGPEGWDSTLYEVVIPKQNPAVRIDGLDPDAPEGDYLPAVRPYGVLRMAWAIWREVPSVEPEEALSLAWQVRQKGQARVLVATRFLAWHVRGMLRARHRLAARLERVG